MSYSISNLEADMEGALHGTTVNQITNIYGIFNRAARDVLADIDPAETKRQAQITGAIFDQVYDYACPSDLKGDRIVDILPQIVRASTGEVQQLYNQDFELLKSQLIAHPSFTTFWNTGIKSLKINIPQSPTYLLNSCDSLTDNGTWTANSQASNLSVDTLNFVFGSGSLQFTLSGAGPTLSGSLSNPSMTAVDLSTVLTQGSLFAYVWVPSGASITNFKLRWGSSSSNYYEQTVTTNQEGTVFQTGWNLLRFDWSTATTTGSPVVTAINYLDFIVNATGTSVFPLRLNQIIAQTGNIYNIEYYSKYLFRDGTTGAFKETATTTTDIINLDTDSYQVYFNKVMVIASQQLQGIDAAYHDGPFFQQEYDKSVMRYQAKYKAEIQKPQSNYYNPNTPGYSQYYGSRRFTM